MGEAHTMKYIDPKNREAVFNWITDLYVKHFTKVPLVINYHRWMGAGKDWAGEENFLIPIVNACWTALARKAFPYVMMLSE